MTSRALPHAFPFRFVESILEDRPESGAAGAVRWRGRVKAAVSANGRATQDGAWASPLLYAEAIAQAALLLEGGDPRIGRQGFLAGIDGFQARRAPEAGETLAITVQLAARFGGIVKFEGEVRSGDEVLALGSVLVKKGEEAPRG